MAEQHFSEQALDAGVAAWFGVTKVEAERNFIRDRMQAAVAAVLDAQNSGRALTPLQYQLFALERCIESQEALAKQIDEANPGDPWASLMVTEDIDLLKSLHASLAIPPLQAGEANWHPVSDSFASHWLTNGAALHPLTVNLVVRFARALAAKLAAAEKKYGYSDGWRSGDWMDECRAKLMEHIAKGDPRDVAAYCAFLWHHGESTATPPAPTPTPLTPEEHQVLRSAVRDSAEVVAPGRMAQQDTKESRCANCGKPQSQAAGCIADYPEEGEWFCSEECYDQHGELGCPHEHHNGYRHPKEAARLIACENALRSLASYLGCGGYNAPEVDAAVFEEKIRYGIDNFATPPAEKQTWTPDQVERVEKEAESMLGKLQASPQAPSGEGEA